MTIQIRPLATDELPDDAVSKLRAIMVKAFGDDPDERFTDDDWEHALGGRHFLVGGQDDDRDTTQAGRRRPATRLEALGLLACPVCGAWGSAAPGRVPYGAGDACLS